MDILQLITASNQNKFINEYFEKVVSTGLLPYRKIYQTNSRSGSTLYDHVLNGVLLIWRLSELLDFSEEERKVMIAAYTVHDLNKVSEYSGRKFLEIATEENILGELDKTNMNKIFTVDNWLSEISYLVRNHPEHYAVGGENFIPDLAPTQIPLDRGLEQMVQLIKAVDISDLSKTFSEKEFKDKMLIILNRISEKQFSWVWHRITEYRGILTNLFHNVVSEFLLEKYNWYPLFIYPEGIYYLVEQSSPCSFLDDDFSLLVKQVEKRVNQIIENEFTKFITARSAGIKIDAKCLELGIDFEQIWDQVNNLIIKKTPKDDFHLSIRDKGLKKLKGKSKQEDDVKKLIMQSTEEAFTTDEYQVGELLRTYYSFLKTHTKTSSKEAWNEIYQIINLDSEHVELLEWVDALYCRAYIVARYLMRQNGLTDEELNDIIVEHGTNVLEKTQNHSQSNDQIGKYLQRVLQIAGLRPDYLSQIEEDFIAYQERPQIQCSTCGMQYDVQSWMAGDVPPNIKVQYFSNRLKVEVVSLKETFVESVIINLSCKRSILKPLIKMNNVYSFISAQFPHRFFPCSF